MGELTSAKKQSGTMLMVQVHQDGSLNWGGGHSSEEVVEFGIYFESTFEGLFNFIH